VLQTFAASSEASIAQEQIASLSYNQFDSIKFSFLVGLKVSDSATNKFYLVSYDQAKSANQLKNAKEKVRNFACKQAFFIGKSKVVQLSEEGDLQVFNFEQESSAKLATGLPAVAQIFESPTGKLLLLLEDSLVLFDVTTKKAVSTLVVSSEIGKIKRAVWNADCSFLALLCKKQVHVLTKGLAKVCSFFEKFNVKNAIWNKRNILYFSTINHLKYGLLNGDIGILKCLENKIHLVCEAGDIIYIDAGGSVQRLQVRLEEVNLKNALFQKSWEDTKHWMKATKPMGQALIAYFYEKNYSALVMDIVTDKAAKFSLALSSGSLELAYKISLELKTKDALSQLAQEALRQGNHQIVEVAYQKLKEYEKLSFLYAMTGKR